MRTKGGNPNIEVTMQVCDDKGDIVPDSLSHGEIASCNDSSKPDTKNRGSIGLESVYRSLVYYHLAKINWNEVVKISVNPDKFCGSHLKFTFRHCSRNDVKERPAPFAMAYLRLVDSTGTTLRNGNHDLCVYKVERNGRDIENAMYLDSGEYRDETETKPRKGARGEFT